MPCGSSKGNSNHDQNDHCAFEDLDHSVLQQPINLGVTNVRQILRCIQSGSKEVKDIILNECNIIYECKVCDGLFRSLANFLYHKRCYCKKHLCEDMLLFDNFDEEIITVNPEPPLETKDKTEKFSEIARLVDCTVNLENMEFKSIDKSSNLESSKGKKGSTSQDVETEDKTVSTMISRRTRNKKTQTAIKVISTEEPPVKCTNMISARIIRKDSNDKTNTEEKNGGKDGKMKKITITKFPDSKKTKESPFPKVIFKAIDSNPHAVFQDSKWKREGSNSSATKAKNGKDKVLIAIEKDAKVENPKARSPGSIKKFEKLKEFHLTRRKRLLTRKDCDLNELRCLTCKTQFMSLRTLYFHMLSLHSKKRLYYPCPFCETLFVQMYGVSRHLMTIHNKNKEQISKLREVIKKKSIWKKIEDVQPGFIGVCEQKLKSEVKEIKEENSMLNEDAPEAQPAESGTISQTTKIALNSKSEEYSAQSKSVEIATHSMPVEIATHSKPVEITTHSKPVETAIKSKPVVERQPLSDLLSKKSDKSVILHPCGKCGRIFGRKSSQVSHEKFCIMNTLIKKEIVDDPPAVSPSTSISSPVLSFEASPHKQTSTTPVKQETRIPLKQGTPTPLKQATPQKPPTPASQKPATPAPQKQSAQAPRKQATPKATCVLRISEPGATPVSKTTKPENNPVNRPAVEMPATMFNIKLSTRPKRGAEKQMHKDFVNSQTLKWRSANRVDTSANSKAHVPVKKASGKTLEKTVLGFINSDDLTCLKCKKKFSSYSNLRRHVAIHVGWTRFKCRYCEYQAYNKSQCWSHVQKTHAVEDEEVEKYIVYLTNCGPRKKSMQKKVKQSDVSGASSTKQLKRKAGYNKKTISMKKQKQIKDKSDHQQEESESDLEDHDIKAAVSPLKVSKKSLPEMEKDRAKTTITLTKVPRRDGSDAKSKPRTITFRKVPLQEAEGGRYDKKEYVIPLQKAQLPDNKKESSYKTLTTSKPTTIILSKTIPHLAVQPVKAESASKTSPTRTSPRKPETKIVEENMTSSAAPRIPENTKVTPLKIQVRSNSSTDEAALESGASSCSKKQKLVSEWFPKKEGRRDSAPLIIGLVPASSSPAKNFAEAPEDE